ncbi:MAG: sulfatase-like hydrolase/transferase [Thermoleophilaceae bacterium]
MKRAVLAVVAAVAVALIVASCSSDEPTAKGPGRAQPVGQAPTPRHPHVVLLVMDELPGDSLLDGRGRIDRVRYPGFAALAGDSTWFRNAYSVFDSTTKAVPLILDGRRPRPRVPANRRGHPRSLYDVFGRRGYRMVASEEASALCPPRMCEGGRRRRPAIVPKLLEGRPQRFARWLRSIRASRRPGFWVKHLLLPHGPWLHLPSGLRTRPRPRDLLPGMSTVPGFADEFLTRHNEQRYLLQLGFTDRLVGRLLRRLKSQGIYDDTLIVVTADHGYLWRSGVETRRRALADTAHEVAPVPLLVKRPGQRRGRVSDAYARTLDVPATIADVLGFELGYRQDGRSAFGPAARRTRRLVFPTRDFSDVVMIAGRPWEARRRTVVRRRLREFGSGPLGTLFTGIGPNRELIGRAARSVTRVPAGSVRASVVQARMFGNVRRRSGVLPSEIAGHLRGGRPGERRDLAVAVNGRIEAVGRSFHLTGDSTEHFAFMVPGDALREGRNAIVVYEVVAGGRLRALGRS